MISLLQGVLTGYFQPSRKDIQSERTDDVEFFCRMFFSLRAVLVILVARPPGQAITLSVILAGTMEDLEVKPLNDSKPTEQLLLRMSQSLEPFDAVNA